MPVTKKKRILYFIQLPPPVHGVSMINQYISSSACINEGFEMNILPIRFSATIEGLRRKQPVKLVKAIILLFRLLYRLVKIQPDLVYFSLMPVGTGFWRDLVYLTAIKLSKAKVILHLHNRGIAERTGKQIWRNAYTYAFSNATIIHVSEGLLRNETDILDLKNTRKFVVGNTVEDFQKVNGIRQTIPTSLLFISNLLEEKGLLVLLEAMVKIREQIPDIRLNAYGATRSRREDDLFAQYFNQHGLSGSVTLHGPVYGAEKEAVLLSGGIFVFPSYFREECFPLSLLEAMQAKLPVIATGIGAIPEIIRNGQEGILVDPLSSDQLANAIITLVKNQSLRAILGKNAQRRFREQYAMPLFEEKMKGILNSVAGG